MNLDVFKETIKQKQITVQDHKYCVDVYYSSKLCAKIFMDKDFAYWADTSSVPIEYRRSFVSALNKFVDTPYTERRNRLVARHSKHMYVKSVDMKKYYNSFVAQVEMVGDADKADTYMTQDKKDVLVKLFGKEIHFVRIIE